MQLNEIARARVSAELGDRVGLSECMITVRVEEEGEGDDCSGGGEAEAVLKAGICSGAALKAGVS
jgi:hypothetical protein